MELFSTLLGNLLLFVYHCFDRIVIHGVETGFLATPGGLCYCDPFSSVPRSPSPGRSEVTRCGCRMFDVVP